jgi:hypothetical protein
MSVALITKPLSKSLVFNQNLMLKCNFNQGYLVANVPRNYPKLLQTDQLQILTSLSQSTTSPASRSVFQIEPGNI